MAENLRRFPGLLNVYYEEREKLLPNDKPENEHVIKAGAYQYLYQDVVRYEDFVAAMTDAEERIALQFCRIKDLKLQLTRKPSMSFRQRESFSKVIKQAQAQAWDLGLAAANPVNPYEENKK